MLLNWREGISTQIATSVNMREKEGILNINQKIGLCRHGNNGEINTTNIESIHLLKKVHQFIYNVKKTKEIKT